MQTFARAFALLLVASSAHADDVPLGPPRCDGLQEGDPCDNGTRCGTCRPCGDDESNCSCTQLDGDAGVADCVVCQEIHDCTPLDAIGCNAAGILPPAAAVIAGLGLAWAARRRKREP